MQALFWSAFSAVCETFRMNNLTPDNPSQPNLDFSADTSCSWPLRFWLIIALTGVIAGLAGGLLMRLLHAVEHVAWRYRTGTLLEAISRASASRHVLMLLAAGLLVGVGGKLIRKLLGPGGEAEAAIWFRSGHIPTVSTLVQAVQSIVTVAMGISLGRESPIKQAGGAIASRIAQWGGLSRPEQRLLVACGVGAGMAAAYNVPVGGALFAVEVLLGSISLRLALPALLCSGIATAASWLLLPTGPIYRVPEYPLSLQLAVWSLLAGPILGLATVPLVRAIGWADAKKPHGNVSTVVTPVVLFTILGIVSIAYPQLLGNGKDAVQLAFSDQFGIVLLLVLPGLKLLATAGSLRAGASGGLFTPTMTIGALLGGLLGHLWDRVWPGASMGSCSVIGSCAFLAAASQGPISALVLVLELTRHIDATMVPMLLAVAGAMLIARRIESGSIYSIRLHLGTPRNTPAAPTRLPHLEHLISQNFVTMSAATGYAHVIEHLLSSRSQSPIYVLDHKGELVGMIDPKSFSAAQLGAMPAEAAQAGDMVIPVDRLNSKMAEGEILDRIAKANLGELPIIDTETSQLVSVATNSRIRHRPDLPLVKSTEMIERVPMQFFSCASHRRGPFRQNKKRRHQKH
jgi:chloride channel protein, CIC family